MNKYAQIFIGGTGKNDLAWEKVESLIPRSGLDGIIIGWSENPELYEKCRQYTREKGIKLYFWLPVFSEMSGVARQSPFRLKNGEPAKAVGFTDEESFDFCCVSNPHNTMGVADYFNRTFLRFDFDGVFLDRVRYPSFTAGIETMLGCRCPSCQDAYEKMGSISDLEAAEEYLRRRIADERCQNPLGLCGYKNGEWIFEDSCIAELFKTKQNIISDAVIGLIKQLRGSVKEVGLDLFAPFMSSFVGQSYKKLAEASDFIKPMLYRHTYTPAGFGFEIGQMTKAVSTEKTIEARGEYIKKLLGIDENGNTTQLMEEELRFLKEIKCPVMAGIEIHTAQGCPAVTPEHIAGNLALLERSGLKGVTACWNILEASEENRNTFFG